jgi:hypothetical protein
MQLSIGQQVKGIRKLIRKSGLCRFRITILTPPGSDTFEQSGSPDPTVPYVALTGHEGLLCIAAPLSEGLSPAEIKAMDDIESSTSLHVLIPGYYPLIREDYRATFAGSVAVWDITNAESDSQGGTTRLALKKSTI